MRRMLRILAGAALALLLLAGGGLVGWWCSQKLADSAAPVATAAPPADPAAGDGAALSEESTPDPAARVTAPPLATPTGDNTGPPAGSADPATPARESAAPDASPPKEDTQAARLARLEQWILEGAYAAARTQLEPLTQAASPTVADRARFLKGVCSELLGDVAAAGTMYEQLAAMAESAGLRRQAELAYARVLLRTGRQEPALETLYREVLQLGPAELDPLDADAIHLLAQTLGDLTFSQTHADDPFREETLFSQKPGLDLRRLLEQRPETRDDIPWPLPSTLEFRCEQRLGEDPSQLFVSLRGANLPLQEVVQRLAELAGRSPQWSSSSLTQVKGRSVTLDVEGIDLALVLDAVLGPVGLTWLARSERLEIMPTSELNPEQAQLDARHRLRRALQFSLAHAPDHPWSAAAYLLLGRLEAVEERWDSALQMQRHAQRLSRGRKSIEAHLNEGKLALRGGDREAALAALYRCVDAVEVHPLKAVAYLYLGRLHLEADAPHAAIAPLQRALLLTKETPHEPLAAVLLASALLLDGNPLGANAVLHNRRSCLSESQVQDAAAFLSAYARYQVASEPDRRKREAAALIETLTGFDPTRLFGSHWRFLVASAFREVGLTPEGERLTREALHALPDCPLRDRLALQALQDHLQRDLKPDASDLLTTLTAELPFPRNHEARLMVAEVAVRRGLDDLAAAHCRTLVEDPTAPTDLRRTALRLLGRIHQRRGEHHEALRCFTGLAPGAPWPDLDLKSLSQNPAHGERR